MSETADAPRVTDLGAITQRDTREGVWVQPDPFEAIEFKVRAFTPGYQQKAAAALVKLARAWQGLDNVPADLRERSDVGALFDECIMDVRSVALGGKPAALADVKALCMEARGAPAMRLARAAVQRADNMRAADAEDALGNSAPSSSGNPSGAEVSSS